MNIHTPTKLTIEEFFSWAHDLEARGEHVRCELVGGHIKMQPYVKLNHTRITNKILLELVEKLNAAEFEAANGDFAVQTGPNSLRFADVMVMPSGKDGNILSADDAIILFEVLSKSTMHKDFGEKKQEYQALESLQAYIVLAQDEPMIWAWFRGEDGNWNEEPEQISDGELVLNAVGVTMKVIDLYRGVN